MNAQSLLCGGGGSQQSLILQFMRSVFSIFVCTSMSMLVGGGGVGGSLEINEDSQACSDKPQRGKN